MDLKSLYQELILDHSRNPRNFGPLPGATREADGFNPLCGDKIHLFLKLDGEIVTDAHFVGSGCAISQSSASILTDMLKGKKKDEALKLFELFQKLVTGVELTEEQTDELGKLAVFQGVQEFPARIKCATLSWHTLKAALENQSVPVKTE